jgi:hypothetical protein
MLKVTSPSRLLSLMIQLIIGIKALLTLILKVKVPKSFIFSLEVGQVMEVLKNISQLILWSLDIASIVNIVVLLISSLGTTTGLVLATRRKHSQTLTGPSTTIVNLAPLSFLNENFNH